MNFSILHEGMRITLVDDAAEHPEPSFTARNFEDFFKESAAMQQRACEAIQYRQKKSGSTQISAAKGNLGRAVTASWTTSASSPDCRGHTMRCASNNHLRQLERLPRCRLPLRRGFRVRYRD